MTTATLVPDRSLEQRFAALEAANQVRSYRAQLKLDLKARRRDVLTVLADPPAEVLTMRILDLLLAVPKFGRVKANKTLSRCRISPSKTVGGLTERQREEVVRLLRRGATQADQRAYRERLGRP